MGLCCHLQYDHVLNSATTCQSTFLFPDIKTLDNHIAADAEEANSLESCAD